jgi:hypothetical protein
MNEYVWQLGSYLARTGDLLELSLQLNNTPMSAVGSKSSYGFPDEVARDLLMNWEHWSAGKQASGAILLRRNWTPTGPQGELRLDPPRIVDRKISSKSVVGVTGFEPATPTSRT